MINRFHMNGNSENNISGLEDNKQSNGIEEEGTEEPEMTFRGNWLFTKTRFYLLVLCEHRSSTG